MKCVLTSSHVFLATVMARNHWASMVGERFSGVHCCVSRFHLPASGLPS